MEFGLTQTLACTAIEEEEVAPKLLAALDRGRTSLDRGEGIPYEEIRREFGLH